MPAGDIGDSGIEDNNHLAMTKRSSYEFAYLPTAVAASSAHFAITSVPSSYESIFQSELPDSFISRQRHFDRYTPSRSRKRVRTGSVFRFNQPGFRRCCDVTAELQNGQTERHRSVPSDFGMACRYPRLYHHLRELSRSVVIEALEEHHRERRRGLIRQLTTGRYSARLSATLMKSTADWPADTRKNFERRPTVIIFNTRSQHASTVTYNQNSG